MKGKEATKVKLHFGSSEGPNVKILKCKRLEHSCFFGDRDIGETRKETSDFGETQEQGLMSKELERLEVKSKNLEASKSKKSSPIYKKSVFDIEGRNLN